MSSSSVDIHQDRISILDFGSQYTQLIARRIRELGVYCEIHSSEITESQFEAFEPNGVVLSGGPESVTEEHTSRAFLFVHQTVPVLGICYGMQTMAEQLGGRVASVAKHEFGHAAVQFHDAPTIFLVTLIDDEGALLNALDVWMSHGDQVEALPEGFSLCCQY